MPMPRKYSAKDAPVVGAAIEFLNGLADFLPSCVPTSVCAGKVDECRSHADALYDYIARNLYRRGKLRGFGHKCGSNLAHGGHC